jgi:hypothetical protein
MKFQVNTYALVSGVLIAGIAVFLFSTMRVGLDWDGDYALYIMNAQNIAEGRPYAVTGFLPNPANPIHPAAYPPGLPLMLAPVYASMGLDLQKMKCVGIVSFVLFLAVFSRTALRFLPPPLAVAATATIGLHPYFWDFKDTIFSELPFLFFCYAALHLFDDLNRPEPKPRRWMLAGAGFTLAYAYLVRTVGIVLLPVALLAALCACRRAVNPGTIAVAVAAAICGAVNLLFPNDLNTYAGYFGGVGIHEHVRQLLRYSGAATAFIGSKTLFGSPLLAGCVIFALAILVLLGLTARIRARWTIYEIFFISYACFLMLYPVDLEPDRYSLPLWPLLILYSFHGAQVAGRHLGRSWRYAVPAALCVVFAALFWHRYSKADFGPIPYSVTAPQTTQLFRSIKARLPADAVLLARKPTIVALFTDRRATIWPLAFTDAQLFDYMQSVRADYVVQDVVNLGGIKHGAHDELDEFIERNRSKLTLLFSNEWFRLYQVRKPY